MFELPMLPRTLDAAYRDLGDPRARVRVLAISDLVRATPEDQRAESVRRLELALQDSEAEVVRAALLALSDVGDAATIRSISRLLSHPDTGVRALAILALGELGDLSGAGLIEAIQPFVRAHDPRVRYQALIATARLGAPSALGLLLLGVADEDAEIADISLRLIEEGVDRGAFQVDEAVVVRLDECAQSSSDRNRALAERILLDVGHPRSTEALGSLLRGAVSPRELGDLELAIVTVGRLRRRELASALEKRAFGAWGVSWDPFRYLARAALAAHGSDKAGRAVRRDLAARSKIGRAATIIALGRVEAHRFAGDIEQAGRRDPDLQDLVHDALARLAPRGND